MIEKKAERVELHLHTKMSDAASVITPREAIETAVKMGYRAVAITDLNTVQSFAEVANCHLEYRNQIKVIYGAVITADKSVTILAKNKEGLKSLRRIISSMDNRNVVQELTLHQNRQNLLYGTDAIAGDLYLAIQENKPYGEIEKLALFYDYIALFPETEPEINKKLYALGKQLGIPVVAVGNCRYIDPEDMICVEVLGQVWRNRSCNTGASQLRTTEEMLQKFAYLGEDVAYEIVVTNTNKIADIIEFIDPVADNYPAFTLPDAYETVAELCKKRLEELYGVQVPSQIRKRIDTELSLLGDNASMYLLCHRLVKFLQKKGAITGNRGTVGSTLIAYLMDISDINPLPAHYRCPNCKHTEIVEAISGYDLPGKHCSHCGNSMISDGHNIPFETCMGLDGSAEVDIDINMPQGVQKDAIAFLADCLGKDRVAFAGTVGTFMQRSAESCVQAYFQRHSDDASQTKECIAQKLIGVKRSLGQYFAGIVLLPEGMEWEDITPIRPASDPVGDVDKVTHMNYRDLQKVLPKLDVLSYGVLDRVQKLFALTGAKPEDIQYNDPNIYQLFKNLDTVGIPEFSSEFTKGILSLLENINFSDLVRVSGMAHGTNTWLDNGENLIQDHSFQELIGDRDDVFLRLQKYGVDRESAYEAMTATRRGILNRKKSLLEKLQNAGVPQWYLESMKTVCYLFPKAHAVHYVKLAMTLAWFKINYPEQFYNVTLQDLHVDEFLHYSDAELEQMLSALNKTDCSKDSEREKLTLVVEARHRGYIK